MSKARKTSIGGQAVIEGVMMRGPHNIAIAVRKPDGEIEIKKDSVKSSKSKIRKVPVLRGVIAFFESLIIGINALMYSAEFFDIEDDSFEEYKPSKFEAWLENKFGDKIKTAVIYISVFLSLIFGIGVFMLLPAYIMDIIRGLVKNHYISIAAEGVLRIGIFLAYLSLVSRMKDIKRVFMYHGAEHKTIFCYESGEELTVQNVRKFSALHPRCGTSFLLFVMVVSIILFSFISSDYNILTKILYRLALLPIVAGVSYEIIKLAGRHDNLFVKIISTPGMWLQRLTTREPDDKQLEVAIASLVAVIPENKEDDKW